MDAGVIRGARVSLRRIGRVCLLSVPGVLAAGSARAHTDGLSQSSFEWREPRTLHAVLVFAWQDAVLLAKALPAAPTAAGAPEAPDVPHAWDVPGRLPDGDAFAGLIARGVAITADGAPCPGFVEDARPHEGDGFLFLATFECPARPRTLRVTLPLLRLLPGDHRHLLRLAATGTATPVERTLSAAEPGAELVLPPPPASGAGPRPQVPARDAAPLGPTVRGAVALGLRHLLSGWDHLMFVAGIALGADRLRAAVLPVTAFTLAHSITLAAAALGLCSLDPRVVEPAIAASIAYVAFENVWRPLPRHRAAVTFAFGLLHGFGFAGALADLQLTRERLLPTLLGFNLGVEAGQLGVLLPLLPLVLWLKPKAHGKVARGACLALGAAGLVLCAVRLVA